MTLEGCDKDVQFYTGLPSAKVFYHLLDFAAWRESDATVGPGRPGTLSQVDELFLTLIRLKDLADSEYSQLGLTFVIYDLVYCPFGQIRQATIKSMMPAVFKEQYPYVTATLDATEIKASIPSSLLLQSQTYSVNIPGLCFILNSVV